MLFKFGSDKFYVVYYILKSESFDERKISIFCKVFLIISFVIFQSCVESEISRTLPAVTSGSISGTAIDVFTGEALADTWLCLEDGTTCTQTDSDGNYTFNNVSFGEHTITPYDGDAGSVLITLNQEIPIKGLPSL